HAAGVPVRSAERPGKGVDRSRRHPGRLALRQPVSARLARRERLDEPLQLGAVPQSLGDGVEARVLDEVVAPENRAEAGEEIVVGGADGEVTITGAKGLVRRVEAMRGAEAAGDLARVPVLGRLPRRERKPGLEQRRVDELPPAGDTPRAPRAQDPDTPE